MSSYNQVFGGGTLHAAQQTYLSLTFSVDQTLVWPVEQSIAGVDVVADIMDLDATAPGLNVDLPDARQVSNGIQSVFNNVGANTLTIRDSTGATIISLTSGTAFVVYLRDNSTAAGLWRTFQLGAGTTSADAGALAGAGLKAITTTLNQRIAPTSTAVTPITLVDGDRAEMTIWTGGVGILNLPNPVTVGADWFHMIRNSGTGDLTVTPPSGTVDDGSTLVMSPSESAIIVTDGSNFFTIGFGQSSTSIFDFISIAVPGSGDFTLSGVQLNRISYQFTGILTGNRNIIVPSTIQQYWIDNSTTGAFSLNIKTAAQITPITVPQGNRNILYCDGADVVDAESGTITLPLAIASGGTGATTASTALLALGGAAIIRDMIAGLGLVGGGDLSADRTFNVGAGVGILANANDVALDPASALNADHAAISVLAGAGLTGGGPITVDLTLNVIANADGGIIVNADDIQLAPASLTQFGGVELATILETSATILANRAVTPNSLGASTNKNFGLESGNFTPTFVGFSAAPLTALVHWMRQGNIVFILLDFSSGTSDSTAFTITNIPTEIQAVTEPLLISLGNVIDNSNVDPNQCTIQIGTAGTWFFGLGLNNEGGGGWTAANLKGFQSRLVYFSYVLDFTLP